MNGLALGCRAAVGRQVIISGTMEKDFLGDDERACYRLQGPEEAF
jgi:hypothetical protein